jgi:hypothetical protein
MNEITENDIREKLSTHYGGNNSSRRLVRNERPDDHGGVTGSIVYSLEGSPPKGYAIVIPELRLVNLYDHQGERFREMIETVVKTDE